MSKSHYFHLFALIALLSFVGCAEPAADDAAAPDAPAAAEEEHGDHDHAEGEEHAHNHSAAEHDAHLVALKAADAIDGAEDNVVSKCYMCALGMDGSDEHTVDYEGYTCKFCSGHCAEAFSKDPGEAIASNADLTSN